MDVPGEAITVTYSPLTGSSVVYDRSAAGIGPMEISQYVLHSGLVMNAQDGSLRPQMSATATCGPHDGTSLAQIPFEEMSFGSWRNLHLDTWVASSATNLGILYTLFPYGSSYRDPTNTRLIYPVESGLDPRLPPKELVLGVRSGSGGKAFSLRQLDQLRNSFFELVSVANSEIDNTPIVLFWNAAAQTAKAYLSELGGQELHFFVEDGLRRDEETGSVWNLSGQAVGGPLDGQELTPISDTITAYWFAWAAFHPDTDVWAPPITASLLPVSQLAVPEDIDWALSTR
jgi:hypothetical protein